MCGRSFHLAYEKHCNDLKIQFWSTQRNLTLAYCTENKETLWNMVIISEIYLSDAILFVPASCFLHHITDSLGKTPQASKFPLRKYVPKPFLKWTRMYSNPPAIKKLHPFYQKRQGWKHKTTWSIPIFYWADKCSTTTILFNHRMFRSLDLVHQCSWRRCKKRNVLWLNRIL